MLLRDKYFHPAPGLDINLGPPDPHIVTDSGIRQLLTGVVLLDQPVQDPPRGMALLAWRSGIGPQHRIDGGLERIELR
ncbi:hypothetical protein MAGR_72910 [Mycolicibacterium agri]|uniref:Uncharacterized protein n=1 Tax=Mycolicibacterium agri TaxID=36811 RepID=A0A7I9WET8_MYCAG|nr:hypothetical protein MAGR_23280 [Mycolicibacterium agri]GFG52941.1 hypothetical protein MAGR_43820 [Mycolicibacterium agri]GFG54057.1 hypothetical protein MAGR_54980 [Mycolicibacterium agri]GFG55850.1 hypothetical protein MAGR_72910 [Mycolicibacterium agri]